MSLLNELVKEIQTKHTTPTGVHNNPNVHGPDSLFGVSGLDRDVISSRVSGSGLASAVPAQGSVKKYPLFPYIVGKNAPSGTQSANSCDDAPTAGAFRTCLQTAQFGVYSLQTRELELDTVGAVIDEGEMTDLRFVNDPLAAQMGSMFMGGTDNTMALEIGREVLMRLVEVGLDFQEILSTQIYSGSGTTNEFPGLELLVTTEHYDAKTGILCESLASDVRDFGDVDITTSGGASAIVSTLVNMYRKAQYNAQTQRMDPVEFAFVMRPQLFINIADVWPCAFMTSGCATASASAPVIVNSDEQIRQRVDMQTRKYLLIDGDQVPVIEDPWLSETDLGENLFSSDIYLLPFTIRGGRRVLFWEYFDYSRGVNQAVLDGRLGSFFWMDQGRYLVAVKSPKNFCVQWQVKIEPRIRLSVPQLAGRLASVGVTLDTHWNDVGTGLPYSQTGGNAYYNTPYVYDNSWA